MERGIALAGNILLDHIKLIDSYPEKGLLVKIRHMENAIGGLVCNTGTDLCKIDPTLKVRSIGRVGRDGDGEFLKNALRDNGLDVSGVESVEEPTTYTDVMTVASTGERTFFTYTGADATMREEDFDVDGLDCDIFHAGYVLLLDGLDEADAEYGTKMAKLLARVQKRGIKTSIDVISENSDRFGQLVNPALRFCNYAVLNEIESGRVVGIPARDESGKLIVGNMKKICEAFFARGVRDAVVIHCPEAGFALDASGKFAAVPSLNLPKDYIKGAVGAGDAFCAGALYAFYRGFDLEYMLRFASACAACNLSEKDSVSGMRDFENTMKLETQFGRNEL